MLFLLAQTEDPGPTLPENPGSALVWIVFLGVVIGLYLIVKRTRQKAEDEFWERKRREEGR